MLRSLRLAPVLLLVISACGPDAPRSGELSVSVVDGAAMVFVPAGEFLMGAAAADPDADPDERPEHRVYLDAFWVDRLEVTNAMYAACVGAGGCTPPAHSRHYGPSEYQGHPVLGVSWNQAVAYCAWAGRRLPTEAEWEKAARGPDGRRFPWGNEAPDPTRLNFDRLVDDTVRVGSYPPGASPYGALDMGGNVWEWVSDGYDPDYYARSPAVNPTGGDSVSRRGLRGGSWNTGAANVRATNRFWAFPGRNDTDGFRCALSYE
jgi:formylglycine-generating enzyme required for sulfatase activity